MLQPDERSEHILTVQIQILQVHLLKYLNHLVVCLQFQKLLPHMDYSPTINFNCLRNGFRTIMSCTALLHVGQARKKLDQNI